MIENEDDIVIDYSPVDEIYYKITNEKFCLDRSQCYKFTIYLDYYTPNSGYYDFYQDGILVMSESDPDIFFDEYWTCQRRISRSPSDSPTYSPGSNSSNSSERPKIFNSYYIALLLLIPLAVLTCVGIRMYGRHQRQKQRPQEQTSLQHNSNDQVIDEDTKAPYKNSLPNKNNHKDGHSTNHEPEVVLPQEALSLPIFNQQEPISDYGQENNPIFPIPCPSPTAPPLPEINEETRTKK